MHSCVSSCSHICLCYSSTAYSTLCLSEQRAKINVWGQPSQICELSVSGVCRLCVCFFLCTITFMLLDVYVCVCKARRCLSPGPNLWLYREDIRFLSPPHVCVSAAVAVIETVGTVCVCENGEAVCEHVCVRVWWQVTQSLVINRRCLDKVRPLKLSSLSAL